MNFPYWAGGTCEFVPQHLQTSVTQWWCTAWHLAKKAVALQHRVWGPRHSDDCLTFRWFLLFLVLGWVGVSLSGPTMSHQFIIRGAWLESHSLILFQFSIRQPQLVRQSQEKLILCLLAFGGRTANCEYFAEGWRLGWGGVAWLIVGNAYVWIYSPHTTQPLYFSARSHPADKKCSNFIQLGDRSSFLGLQLPWNFFFFFLTVICGFKSPLLGLIFLRLKKKSYIALEDYTWCYL